MQSPNFELARQYALDYLARGLPPHLTYHSLAHTRDDVAPSAGQIAALAGLDGEDLLLVLTAAFYHDTGYVEQPDDHEEGSARLAAAVLPRFGYQPAQIAAIVEMIYATRLPQTPRTLPAQILADADLNVLGKETYLERSRLLRDEMATSGRTMTDCEWYSFQLEFIRNHRYFTSAARTLLDAQKQVNLDYMAALLAQCQEVKLV